MRALAAAVLTGSLAVVPAGAARAAPAPAGSLSVLTYNVAGLPAWISSGDPERNTRPIGERVNAYQVVNVQEDFNYHADLYATDEHPYRTPTSGGVPFGSGLNTMADRPYGDLARVKWTACNGTDCLTPKGFTYKRLRLAEGVHLDLYNLHANAGTTPADLAARRANLAQLTSYIKANSAGGAVLVMGDTNTRYTRAGDTIRDLASATGLTDAWVARVRGGTPPAMGDPALVCDDARVTDACEVVDKILFRGSRHLALRLTGYANANARFRTADGKMLSDHYPIAAAFAWSAAPDMRLSDQAGGPHGTPFTDVEHAGRPVRQVSLRAAGWLDQVGLRLSDGTSLVHGGSGGTARTLDLADGEHLTGLRLDTARYFGRTRVSYAEFRTSEGRTLSGGVPTAATTAYAAPPGWQITGFHGRAGGRVDRLGVIYTPR
ncbi:jacalin-like lectin [Spirillospora sp. NPDC127200]